MKKIIQHLILLASIIATLPLSGQQYRDLIYSGRLAGLQDHNSIEAKMFKAESVMKHQRALELTDTQKDKILTAYQNAQSEFTKWQWELQAANEDLKEMVSGEQIDEAEALKQLETMLDLERNIKRTQLGLMIRIKNQLTPEQQKKLRELESPYGLLQSQDQLKDAYRLLSPQSLWNQNSRDRNREE